MLFEWMGTQIKEKSRVGGEGLNVEEREEMQVIFEKLF